MREQKHGRIVMMSPPVNVAKVAGKAPYFVSKMGMTMLALAIAAEERESGIAANALWPVTMIESEATRHFEMGKPEEWRTPEILADATVELCCGPAELTGRALYDEEVLRERRGVTDFAAYSVVPGTTPPPVCREMIEE
jgi:citronellol/citronellal dehydrogenase